MIVPSVIHSGESRTQNHRVCRSLPGTRWGNIYGTRCRTRQTGESKLCQTTDYVVQKIRHAPPDTYGKFHIRFERGVYGDLYTRRLHLPESNFRIHCSHAFFSVYHDPVSDIHSQCYFCYITLSLSGSGEEFSGIICNNGYRTHSWSCFHILNFHLPV